MGEIVNLFQPNVMSRENKVTSGEAVCIACKHTWIAVQEGVSENMLECPACHAYKGHYRFPHIPDDHTTWVCNCGNNLFYVSNDGFFCPNCGTHKIVT